MVGGERRSLPCLGHLCMHRGGPDWRLNDGRTGVMGGWIDRQMDGWLDGQTDGWMDGQTDGWMGGQMDGWMNGWKDTQLSLTS